MIEVILRDGGSYAITKEQIDYWNRLYPELSVTDELNYLKEMWAIESIPRRTAKNINKFINKYLSKENKEDYL